jgi:cytochrome c peroxidase
MKRALSLLVLVLVAALLAWQGGAWAKLQDFVESQRTPRLRVPPGWPAPNYDFHDNPVSAKGFALGRQLFYDPRLSRDGTVSCGSCHQQFAAFAHFDHRVSHGIGNQNGTRNAPGLFNLAWQPDFMWDGAVHHLELQPVAPITNPVEMGEGLDQLLARLNADAGYRERFEQVFGPGDIDSQRLLMALAQFAGTLVSDRSRYDSFLAGKATFNHDERAGLAVFREHCAACHREPLLTDFSYRSNGLDTEPRDAGRGGISGKPAERGLFRVPSLRNVALTAPYMHDGRFDTLAQVLDHYAEGVQPSPNLDPLLVRGFALDAVQRRQLLAFLASLSDERFVADRRFAEPREP